MPNYPRSRNRPAAEPIRLSALDGNVYTPGVRHVLDLRLPAISNLGAYNIDVIVESTSGVAGTDFYFDAIATMPADTEYVFESSEYFLASANSDSPSRHRITITDFDLDGMEVMSPGNDRVASVVIQTAANFAGELTATVDADLLILDTPDVTPTPVPNFAVVQSMTRLAPTVVLIPIPEPATLALIAFPVMWLAVLGHRHRPRWTFKTRHRPLLR